jgi:galactoside O-acetyltransferase
MTKTVTEFEETPLVCREALVAVLRGCGVGVKIYSGCRLCPPDRIEVGDYSQIDEGVRIFAGLGVRLGRHVHLAFGSSISGGGTCEMGDHVGVGAGVRILTGSEEIEGGLTNPTVPADLRRVRRQATRIGDHALLFTSAVILPGVTVGEGSVVAAGSIVHRDLAPWGIYGGHPLVRIGVRNREPILEAARILLEREGSGFGTR